jgi:asparagine synthase (glutamine-hydrolysing)
MFAFAVWDEESRSLMLARDRMGEKPLFVGRAGTSVLFASELRAFCCHPEFRRELNQDAVAALLKLGYIPAPQSIYCDAYKLSPGAFIELRAPADLQDAVIHSGPLVLGSASCLGKRFWKIEDWACRRNDTEMSLDEAADVVDESLQGIIREQVVSDVPIGAFLSGGIDSSLVVATMQSQASSPVRTFTIGFPQTNFDEAPYAEAIASYLGTEHETFDVTTDDILGVVPALGLIYDEPFADSSQIPTVLISRLARQKVTVCLAGDGGDEIFSGYNRYRWMRYLEKHRPETLMAIAATAVKMIARIAPDSLLQAGLGLSGMSSINARERCYRLADVLEARDSADAYERLISYWQRPSEAMAGFSGDVDQTDLIRGAHNLLGPWLGSMLWDQLVYLPGDNLAKIDRASMSVALEMRMPLLDHRLLERVWSLDLRNRSSLLGVSKTLLKRVLYRYVPARLVERPKMGFTVPLAQWLRGPLRQWAEDLLAVPPIDTSGRLDLAVVRTLWAQHLSGARDHHLKLWPVLMLFAWARANSS